MVTKERYRYTYILGRTTMAYGITDEPEQCRAELERAYPGGTLVLERENEPNVMIWPSEKEAARQ